MYAICIGIDLNSKSVQERHLGNKKGSCKDTQYIRVDRMSYVFLFCDTRGSCVEDKVENTSMSRIRMRAQRSTHSLMRYPVLYVRVFLRLNKRCHKGKLTASEISLIFITSEIHFHGKQLLFLVTFSRLEKTPKLESERKQTFLAVYFTLHITIEILDLGVVDEIRFSLGEDAIVGKELSFARNISALYHRFAGIGNVERCF